MSGDRHEYLRARRREDGKAEIAYQGTNRGVALYDLQPNEGVVRRRVGEWEHVMGDDFLLDPTAGDHVGEDTA